MGQVADDIINGRQCSYCGTMFERSHGFPVLCESDWFSDLNSRVREKQEKEGRPITEEEKRAIVKNMPSKAILKEL